MPAVATPSPPLPPPAAIRTRDGACLFVRSMHRSDGETLAAAVAALSPRSRYLRFLTAKPGLTRREVVALTDLDHHAREALVAIDPRTGAWVAVARYAAFPDIPGAADVAVTVADAWQRRGVGTALVELLIRRASREGLARLHATTLAENAGALRLLRRQGFVTAARDGGTLELARDLAVATAPVAPALAVAS